MAKKVFQVEQPKTDENGIEFFLQNTPPSSIACEAHIHNMLEILYVKEGHYTISLDDEEYEIEKGDLTLFCSGAIHHIRTKDDLCNSYYVIKISPSLFFEFSKPETGIQYAMRFALNRKENKKLWKKDELEKSEMKKILDALIAEQNQNGYASDVAIKLKIMELLLHILREDSHYSCTANDRATELIYHVMRYVQEHFSEDIDEKKLASSFGMSYSYFSRSFKKVTGMTFKNYLNRTRISKAEQLLFESGGSISETAIACGYNSISYFISVYRRITGKTPYRALKQSRVGKDIS